MNSRCVAVVRYSILSLNTGKAWTTSSDDAEEYRRRLFDPKRLDLHQRLFTDVLMQSLLCQSMTLDKAWFTLLVLTSTELPEEHKALLHDLRSTYDWIEVKELPPEDIRMGAEILNFLKNRIDSPVYATVRVDDDDALSNDYFNRLSKYLKPEFQGFAVSFAAGYAGLHDGERFTGFKAYYQPNLALGLASIHDAGALERRGVPKQIYQLGNHTLLDRRVPVILDSRQPAYIRTVHGHSDNVARTRKRVAKLEYVSPETVMERFPWVVGQ